MLPRKRPAQKGRTTILTSTILINILQVKQLAEVGEEFKRKLFYEENGEWKYKYLNLKKWDPQTEIREFEYDGVISSWKKPC